MWIIDQGKLSLVDECRLIEMGKMPEYAFKPSGASMQLDATSARNEMVFFQNSRYTWMTRDILGDWTEMPQPAKV